MLRGKGTPQQQREEQKNVACGWSSPASGGILVIDQPQQLSRLVKNTNGKLDSLCLPQDKLGRYIYRSEIPPPLAGVSDKNKKSRIIPPLAGGHIRPAN